MKKSRFIYTSIIIAVAASLMFVSCKSDDEEKVKIGIMEGALVNAPFENSFTSVVVKEYPEVQTLLDTLSEFGPSFMSGSGSSCFVAFDSIEAAKKAQAKIEKLKISSFVARSVKVSNVIEDLNKLQ